MEATTATVRRNAFLRPCQSTTIFGRVELADAVRPIAGAGYRWAELSRNSLNRAESRGLLADLGLNVWAVHGTLGLAVSMGEAVEARRAIENELRAMDEVACYAPCPYVLHHLCRNADPDGPDAWRRVVERLHEKAVELGFILCLESVPKKPPGKGFPYCCRSEEVAAFVHSFGSPHIGICVDLNHANLYEDLSNVAANTAGLVRTIHISDNHGREEEHLPPGEGVIDWLPALRALYRGGYDGPLNMELHSPPSHDLLLRTRLWAEEMADALRDALFDDDPVERAPESDEAVGRAEGRCHLPLDRP